MEFLSTESFSRKMFHELIVNQQQNCTICERTVFCPSQTCLHSCQKNDPIYSRWKKIPAQHFFFLFEKLFLTDKCDNREEKPPFHADFKSVSLRTDCLNALFCFL